ncbi:MAG: signal recognition particle-docking protein FtsY [Phycisphaerae bacterium]|nr:signal recognition particle-docking protein FtsY [Phycisphaerae bacterium]
MALFRSVISKLAEGLRKTRQTLVGGLRALLGGRVLDAALLAEVETTLLQADVGVVAARRLSDSLRADFRAGALARSEDIPEHLKRQLKAMWPESDRRLNLAASGTTVVLVTGINGAGKTTSIAKLTALLRREGKTVLLAACDTFRAGAVRQLEVWAERLGVELIRGQQGGDPAAVAYDAAKAAVSRGVDVLIVDTAGRLHTQDHLMRQLTKIRSVLQKVIAGSPHETLLVLDATVGQNAVRQAEEFAKAVPLTGIFLSKLDGTARGGVVIAVRAATDVPVKFVGLGETPEDVEPFDPGAFVEALFASEAASAAERA